jgi:hypothetical protein
MWSSDGRPAIVSKTLRFLAAGGIALLAGLWREISGPDPDWGVVASLTAGLILAVGGGSYGRVAARGPITSFGVSQRPGGR